MIKLKNFWVCVKQQSLTHSIKSCVRYDNQTSDPPYLTGVREGDNLSPFYCGIFLKGLNGKKEYQVLKKHVWII
jgi:hypothetical protein